MSLSWTEVVRSGAYIFELEAEYIRSLARKDAFVASVGTTSRSYRMDLTVRYLYSVGANATAEEVEQCRVDRQMLLTLACTSAMTKRKRRALKMLSTLEADNDPHSKAIVSACKSYLSKAMEKPGDPLTPGAQLSLGSISTGFPEICVCFRCLQPSNSQEYVEVSLGPVQTMIVPWSLVTPETTQLHWTDSSEPMLKAIDMAFWTETVQWGKNIPQEGRWNEAIFKTKLKDRYGFREAVNLAEVLDVTQYMSGLRVPNVQTMSQQELIEISNDRRKAIGEAMEEVNARMVRLFLSQGSEGWQGPEKKDDGGDDGDESGDEGTGRRRPKGRQPRLTRAEKAARAAAREGGQGGAGGGAGGAGGGAASSVSGGRGPSQSTSTPLQPPERSPRRRPAVPTVRRDAFEDTDLFDPLVTGKRREGLAGVSTEELDAAMNDPDKAAAVMAKARISTAAIDSDADDDDDSEEEVVMTGDKKDSEAESPSRHEESELPEVWPEVTKESEEAAKTVGMSWLMPFEKEAAPCLTLSDYSLTPRGLRDPVIFSDGSELDISTLKLTKDEKKKARSMMMGIAKDLTAWEMLGAGFNAETWRTVREGLAAKFSLPQEADVKFYMIQQELKTFLFPSDLTAEEKEEVRGAHTLEYELDGVIKDSGMKAAGIRPQMGIIVTWSLIFQRPEFENLDEDDVLALYDGIARLDLARLYALRFERAKVRADKGESLNSLADLDTKKPGSPVKSKPKSQSSSSSMPQEVIQELKTTVAAKAASSARAS